MAGTGLQVVFVATLLQVMKGTFFDPVANTLRPLPPHRWHVEHRTDSSKSFLGSVSNRKGLSNLHSTPEFDGTPSTDAWTISLRPELLGGELAAFLSAREIWIDRDRVRWVILSDLTRVDTRRLVRLPLWNSKLKFPVGGLSDGPTEFMKHGITNSAELRVPFGTPADPWELQVDFRWQRVFARFKFHNSHLAAKKTVDVPPGLIVSAVRRSNSTRFGGGSRIDSLGTVYVLIEVPEVDPVAGNAELQFETAAANTTLIPLPAAMPLEEKRPADVPQHPTERYLLPKKWRSGGMEFTAGGSRKSWEDFQNTQLPTSSQAAPLVFHLDDIVLGDTARKPVTIPKDSRIALYDHLLAVRQPDTGAHRPQWWKEKVATNYLPGESAFGASGDHFEQTTRLVHYEGRFFDVREDRVTTGSCIGWRTTRRSTAPPCSRRSGDGASSIRASGRDGARTWCSCRSPRAMLSQV